MAQGQQRRLAGTIKHPKHLLRVAGEPIIARTARMLQEQAVQVVVVGWEDIWNHMPEGTICTKLPEPGTCILDGIYAARDLWYADGPILILLGDVVFSHAALLGLIAEAWKRNDLWFAGTANLGRGSGETFCFGIPGRRWLKAEAEALLQGVPCRNLPMPPDAYQCGHLRNLVWWFQQARGLHAELPLEYHPSVLHVISDWTYDIDTPWDIETRIDVFTRLILEERRLRHACTLA